MNSAIVEGIAPTEVRQGGQTVSVPQDLSEHKPPFTPPNPDNVSHFQRVIGPVLIIMMAVLATVNQYVYKIAIDLYPSTIHEMLFLKGLNSIVIGSIGLAITQKSPLDLHGTQSLFVGGFSALVTINNLLYFLGVEKLPVALSSTLACTLPVMVGVLALIFLRERMNLINIGATLVCIVGLTMVLKQPAVVYGADTKTDSSFPLYVGYMLSSQLVFALVGLLNKRMEGTINCFINIFYLGVLMLTVESLVLYFGEIKTSTSVAKFFIVMGVHSTNTFAQITFYYSHVYAHATTCSYYVFIGVFLAFIIDLILYSLGIDNIQIAGAVVVVLAGAIITTEKAILHCRQQTPVHP